MQFTIKGKYWLFTCWDSKQKSWKWLLRLIVYLFIKSKQKTREAGQVAHFWRTHSKSRTSQWRLKAADRHFYPIPSDWALEGAKSVRDAQEGFRSLVNADFKQPRSCFLLSGENVTLFVNKQSVNVCSGVNEACSPCQGRQLCLSYLVCPQGMVISHRLC